jgi:hypothetical protein
VPVNVSNFESNHLTYRCVACDEIVIVERGEERMVATKPDPMAAAHAALRAKSATPAAKEPELRASPIAEALYRFREAADAFSTAYDKHDNAQIVYQAAVLTLQEARAELAAARTALDMALAQIGGGEEMKAEPAAKGRKRQRRPEGWVPWNKGKNYRQARNAEQPEPSADGAAGEASV